MFKCTFFKPMHIIIVRCMYTFTHIIVMHRNIATIHILQKLHLVVHMYTICIFIVLTWNPSGVKIPEVYKKKS